MITKLFAKQNNHLSLVLLAVVGAAFLVVLACNHSRHTRSAVSSVESLAKSPAVALESAANWGAAQLNDPVARCSMEGFISSVPAVTLSNPKLWGTIAVTVVKGKVPVGTAESASTADVQTPGTRVLIATVGGDGPIRRLRVLLEPVVDNNGTISSFRSLTRQLY